eukprot:scaffold70135_cov19-Tisochrysis_lutea.AAC.2
MHAVARVHATLPVSSIPACPLPLALSIIFSFGSTDIATLTKSLRMWNHSHCNIHKILAHVGPQSFQQSQNLCACGTSHRTFTKFLRMWDQAYPVQSSTGQVNSSSTAVRIRDRAHLAWQQHCTCLQQRQQAQRIRNQAYFR